MLQNVGRRKKNRVSGAATPQPKLHVHSHLNSLLPSLSKQLRTQIVLFQLNYKTKIKSNNTSTSQKLKVSQRGVVSKIGRQEGEFELQNENGSRVSGTGI